MVRIYLGCTVFGIGFSISSCIKCVNTIQRRKDDSSLNMLEYLYDNQMVPFLSLFKELHNVFI